MDTPGFIGSFTPSFDTIDNDNDGFSDVYNPFIQNSVGNFNISTLLIKTAFSKSDEFSSDVFETFKSNRLIIARRLAAREGVDFTNPNNFENGDLNGFPLGFGRTSQLVLLPSFLSLPILELMQIRLA